MLKRIKILKNIDIKFCFIKGIKLLILENKYYITVPKSITCSKDLNFLYFELMELSYIKNDRAEFFAFFNYIDKKLKRIDKPFSKKLIFKGLGLKINLLSNLRKIDLKLGYSHQYSIFIPQTLNLLVKKNILVIEGFNAVEVGNFAYKIRKLKFPNIYKGKGIWYKNESKTLKTIKKT